MRATSVWSIYWLWKAFRLTPAAYHAFSLLLHILNTWLLWAIAGVWPGMRKGAFWASTFFAVHEGRQEAVMWFTAINELWMFLFGAAALWFGLMRGRRLLGLALFFLALFWLVAPHWRKLVPYAALALLIGGSIFLTRGSNNFRFADGGFVIGEAPFWITWPRGVHRVPWIWGWIAAVWIWFRGDPKQRESALRAMVCIGVALVPYIFVTYTTEIPSRQTYLASVGLAMLVGLAMESVTGRSAVAAVAAVMLVHNVGILCVRNRAQFIERAAPTGS